MVTIVCPGPSARAARKAPTQLTAEELPRKRPSFSRRYLDENPKFGELSL
jgi:hypothetical protein